MIHDCGAGISLASENGGLLENVEIYNNIAFSNRANGFEIGNWGEDGISQRPIRNVKFTNNTVYNNGSATWGGGMHLENPDAQNILVRNNIFSQNYLFQMSNEIKLSEQDLTADHNLIHGYREYDDEIRGKDYVEGDPMFVDPSGADFHLQSGSPAIDSGSAVDAPDSDYDGTTRPQSSGIDIGAFEFPSDPSGVDEHTDSIPIAFELFQNYPNPFNAGTVISYQLPESGKVTLKVYNLLGEQVRMLLNEAQDAGVYSVHWDAKDDLGRFVPSGVYIYRIQAGAFSTVNKAVFVK